MSPLQKEYYRHILARNFHVLRHGVRGTAQTSLLNIIMELKKCCNHPFLLPSCLAQQQRILSKHEFEEARINAAGKFVVLDKMLIKLHADGHRVLMCVPAVVL